MERFLQDVRYALRGMRRSPGFTAAAVLTLALGMGATTAIFSVIRAVLLSPLPYREPERRVMIWSRWKDFDKTWVADGEVVDYRRECISFESIATWGFGQAANLTGGGGDTVRIGLSSVTANTFDVLGSRPALGRGFTEEEDLPGGPPVAVLSYGLWQNRFGGDTSVLSSAIELDGVRRRVVGVMPRGFGLPTDFTAHASEPAQVYVPLQIDMKEIGHGNHGLYAAAVLKPGVTASRASAELAAIAANWTRRGLYPEPMKFTAFAVPVEKEIRGGARQALYLVFGAVGFLLLMACVNVANLLLARAEARQREISVRAAIGAGKGRLTRQLLTESFVLAAVGALAGLGLAWAGLKLVTSQGMAGLPVLSPIRVEPSLLLFAALLSIATTFLFGLAPVVRIWRLDLSEAMRDGSANASSGRSRRSLRSVLAGVQMGLAVLLLSGAGLMLKSLAALARVDLGFQPEHVLTLQVRPPEASYQKPEAVSAFYRTLLDRVRGLPGVQAAGLVRSLPLAAEIGDWGLEVEGYQPPPGQHAKGDWQVASDGVFEALGERLVRGRPLSAADTAEAQPVVVVNETLARTYWPGEDPIGRRVRMGSSNPNRPWLTVVGVLHDEKHNGVTGIVKEKFYVPYAQFPLSVGFAARNMTLVARAAGKGDPLVLAAPIRAEIHQLDPNLPVASVRTMTEVLRTSLATPRLTGSLLAIFAGLALFLAAVGVSGVLSYLVNRRRREIGIRMALGASRARVLGLVVKSGMATAAAGVAGGILAAVFLTRLMEGLLYGVAPRDLDTFLSVTVVMLAIAAAASAVPAARAARSDPLDALRSE